MTGILSSTNETQLAEYVKQAASLSTESALAGLLTQAMSAPDVLVFGELLAVEAVQKALLSTAASLGACGSRSMAPIASFTNLRSAEGNPAKTLALLEIFAFGSYSDYNARKEDLPALTEKQSRKLKQLSIVIPYATLLTALDIGTLRELEDLVIDALYRNVFVGKLDHARAQLQVDYSIGRDVKDEDLDAIVATLGEWEAKSKALLSSLEDQINAANAATKETAEHKNKFEKKAEEMRATVKVAMENEVDMGGGALGMMSRMAGGMDFREDVGRKPGKKDKFKHGRRGGHNH